MVLGAQDIEQQGKVLLLRSKDLHYWQNVGEIAGSGLGGLGKSGYMWECPDMFALDHYTFLICCPQGMVPQNKRFLNEYSNAWRYAQLHTRAIKRA